MRTRARLQLMVGILLALWLSGCGGNVSRKDNDGGNVSRKGNVAGTVTDINGDPVVDARVWIDREGETRTNTNGTFLLTNVSEDFKNVQASASIGNQQWSGVALVQVFAGDTTRNANILLCPENLQGSIEGFVYGPDGSRLEGARVFAGGPLTSAMAITDRDGYYRIDGLRGGYDYPMVASAPGFLNDKETVTVVAGQVSSVSFALTRASGTLPATPSNLEAVVWTQPQGVTRSTSPQMANALEAIKRAVDPKRARYRAISRVTPVGSLIEVDLTWDYVEDRTRLGYGIYRGRSPNPASVPDNAIAFLRDPLADLFADLDTALAQGDTYHYQVVAVGANYDPGTGAGTSGPSNNASATPLSPMGTFSSPAQGETVTNPTPTLRWDRLNGASTYRVILYEGFPEINRDPLWLSGRTANNSLVYNGPSLQLGQTYYWVVVAFSADENARSISLLWKFTYRP